MAEVLWFAVAWNWLWIAVHIIAALLMLWAWFCVWHHRPIRERAGLRLVGHIAMRVGAISLASPALIIAGAVIVTDISVTPGVHLVQRLAGQGNSYEPDAAPARTVAAQNTLLLNDIKYGSGEPNSYLDIYIADDNPRVSRPTYVYVHGGGWIGGSKSLGDPNAPGSDFALGNGPMLTAGYTWSRSATPSPLMPLTRRR